MSLSKQLISMIVLLFSLVFVGTLGISIHNTRAYLNKQMASHAQDTATSLGLSLTPAVAGKDQALTETTVDAIFDRGYYQNITIKDMKGKVILERKTRVGFKDVPQWFINAFPLNTPVASSTLTTGWRQIARVYVSSHPGYAYEELWSIATHNALWLTGLALFAVLLIIMVIRVILNPLRAVEKQAIAISSREFPIQRNLPRTRDLRRVVKAMNHMSSKVAEIIQTQTKRIQEMRARAYHDEVTDLQNRRSFEERVKHMIASPEEFSVGLLALVQVDGLQEVNTGHGYTRGDNMLQVTADALIRIGRQYPNSQVARIGGADFAFLAPDIIHEDIGKVVRRLDNELRQLNLSEKFDEKAGYHAGTTWFTGNQDLAELLSSADTALRMAQKHHTENWAHYDHHDKENGELRSATEWREALNRMIDNRSLLLHFQPVRACADEHILHYEVLARMQEDDGSIVSAAVFIPMASHHALQLKLDKLVIETLLGQLPALPKKRYAINIAPTSATDPDFRSWLKELLTEHDQLAKQLIFETTEHAIHIDRDAIQSLINRLHQRGAGFSIDHFGTSNGSFGYLRNLKLDYMKIDGSYIRDIDSKEDNRFFVSSLADIAHNLEIRVIAEYVEREEEMDVLTAMQIDGVQGYLIGKPGELENNA